MPSDCYTGVKMEPSNPWVDMMYFELNNRVQNEGIRRITKSVITK